MARQLRDETKPIALACGLLEDSGRALFLIRRSQDGKELLELPCARVFPGDDPMSKATGAFKAQTGVDAHSAGIALESRHNTGSRKKKHFVPVLVFRMDAKNKTARPSGEFSGFRWLPLAEAKKMRLARNAEWLNST